MEDISQYLLALVVLCVSTSIVILTRRLQSKSSKLPPGTTGYPVVGETLQLASTGPQMFIQQRMQKYSQEVFTTSLLGEKVAVFCGAAGNKFLFYGGSDLLLPWAPASLLKPLTFMDLDSKPIKEEYAKSRSFLHEILKPEALKHYIPMMDSMAREHLKTYWAPYQEVKVFDLSQKYTLSLACRLLLGFEDPKQMQKFSDSFNITMSDMLTVPIDFPGTPYNRAMKEGLKVKLELLKIIAERRKRVLDEKYKESSASCSDILSRIFLDGHGQLMSDAEIGRNLITLLLPTFEATSASITIVLKFLGELPHIYDTVYNENMNIAKSKGPQEMLNWEDIKKMKYSSIVISEAMRLIPPSFGTFREAKTDINYAGFTIPKGWKMFWSPFTTNKDPQYFPNPENFDPSRFEGEGQTPCTFVPFGGGPRMCPGKEYAKFLILVFMYNVVTKFKLQTLVQNEKMTYRAGPVPANGLPMRLQPHQR